MQDFEKLGVFYLGRVSDASGKQLGAPVLYDSRDLVTHAVCVGMTGSGKTGLCLSLIEEAAIDGVPVIAIDPKGDLSNLLLTFPRLAPDDFRPWIDEDEARRAGQSPDAFAAQQADLWRKGLADWGQDGERIQRLRDAAEFAIYTPGSRAGLPISILASFAAPPQNVRDDGEALSERASTTATGILTLAGANGEPRSREHTFVAALLADAWSKGKDLDLPALIQQIQTAPFDKIGVLDLESFYPAKDRFELAMHINTVLAAPGFDQWLEGTPLDAGQLLYTANGRPKVSVISIAHLGDGERMFFVTLLLNEIVAWMRGQTGTSSLRAILYMDEIAGYLPPVAAPPSKAPMLLLLKQARAFGLGVVLATQNPVDLDYKALANTGTWLLGRLQTERDKARVLDGLEGLAGGFDRATADKALSALGKRVFLLHDVHADAPVTFQTRWAMSYLRGPLSRDQIRTLMDGRRPAEAAAAAGAPAAAAAASAKPARPVAAAVPAAAMTAPPVLAPGIQQFFLPVSGSSPHYAPVVLGVARVAFSDTKLQVNESRDVVASAEIGDGAVPVDWASADVLETSPAELAPAPAPGATFEDVPKAAANARNYAAWQKSFSAWLASAQRLELRRHASTGLVSKPGESERDFAVRVQVAQREARDAAVDKVRASFAKKRAQIEERLRRAEDAVQREQQQSSSSQLQTVVSIGATVLGAFLGRRAVSVGTLGRATTAARGLGRSAKEYGDVRRAQETVADVQQELAELDADVAEETKKIADQFEAGATDFDTVSIAPKRGQVSVQFVALGWRPS